MRQARSTEADPGQGWQQKRARPQSDVRSQPAWVDMTPASCRIRPCAKQTQRALEHRPLPHPPVHRSEIVPRLVGLAHPSAIRCCDVAVVLAIPGRWIRRNGSRRSEAIMVRLARVASCPTRSPCSRPAAKHTLAHPEVWMLQEAGWGVVLVTLVGEIHENLLRPSRRDVQ